MVMEKFRHFLKEVALSHDGNYVTMVTPPPLSSPAGTYVSGNHSLPL